MLTVAENAPSDVTSPLTVTPFGSAACPVYTSNEHFTGPAALAKLYRFLADSREDPGARRLDGEDSHEGAWACRTITRCIRCTS